jgi:hypothetical protein
MSEFCAEISLATCKGMYEGVDVPLLFRMLTSQTLQ